MTALRLSEIVRRDLSVDPVITGVTSDSRKVSEGTLFAALPGAKTDGRSFITQALTQGAVAVLAPEDTPPGAAPVLVRTADVRRAYALAAR
jgi:UDP-N-acetylmuramoyl-L-alanyl-D-glutamate--2,6-diaminopimelate ligase